MDLIFHQIKVKIYFYLELQFNMDQINFLDIKFMNQVNLIHNPIKLLFKYLINQIKQV